MTLGFEPSNYGVTEKVVTKVPVKPDDDCPTCRERGWRPVVDQSDCPECYGEDPYGEGQFCAQCQYCCGC